jgi:glyoxylase-like metal-dependent hydrolase (beta-lactamase superfamily II)
VPVKEVLPGVHRLWSPAVDNNAYLIAADELVLVDVGPPKKAEKVLAMIGAAGKRPQDVAAILVTHYHTDHTGDLAALAESTGAEVHMHPLDAEVVRTGAPRPRGRPHAFVGRVMAKMAGGPTAAPAAPVAREVQDGQRLDLLGGIEVLHTPGHTGGHVSFHWTRGGGVLFAGDSATNIWNRLGIASLNEDDEAARASFTRLAERRFAAACFGHGRAIARDASERFRGRVPPR